MSEKNLGESKRDDNYREYDLKDQRGRNHLKLTSDWNHKDDVTDRMIRIKMGDKEALVDYNHLWSLVFLISREEEQVNLIPVQTGRVRMIEKMVEIEAQNDIKKGDKIRTRIEFSIPEEMFVQQTKDSGILIPK